MDSVDDAACSREKFFGAWSKTLRNKNIILLSAVFITAMSTLLQGCGRTRIVELKKEHLFSLPVGKEDEAIGVLRESNGRFVGPAHVLFRNGFFYTVDTVNHKIIKTTTHGDVILTIADGEMMQDEHEAMLRTKQKTYFDFNQIGVIDVDNENNIYVEDMFLEKTEVETVIDIFSIDDESIDEEKEYEEKYMSYILVFDRLGAFLHTIGENGIGSDPFYYMYDIEIDNNGCLVVMTGNDEWDAWTYHRYSPDGELIEKYTLTSEDVLTHTEQQNRANFVMNVIPTEQPGQVLYWTSKYETTLDSTEVKKEEDLWGEEIEIDDYDRYRAREEGEEKEEQVQSIRDLLHYTISFYDFESASVVNAHQWETALTNNVESTEEFIGLDGYQNCFFWKYIDRNKAVITILRPDGSFITKRSFLFESDGIWMDLQIALDGSVSAIKIDESNVHYYRWRSDKLLSTRQEKQTLREFFMAKVEGFKNANR
jgi:hypothetical protein